MQALHYLTLSILIPPLLWVFAEPNALIYEGGAANVGACQCYTTVHLSISLTLDRTAP